MLLSPFMSPSRSSPPSLSISLFSASPSPLLLCEQAHQYRSSRFHIYVLIFDTCFSLSLCMTNSRFIHISPSCPALCDPMDSPVLGILQARILEWVAIPFSFSLFMAESYSTVCIYCIFISIHLLIDILKTAVPNEILKFGRFSIISVFCIK